MSSLSRNYTKYIMYFVLTLFAVGFTGCSNDDDVDDVTVDPEPTGTITVQDQTISQNTIIVENVTVGQDSWLVARNAGDEDNPEIVSEAVFVEAGSHDDVELPLLDSANLSGNVDGDDIVVMIHADDQDRGTPGTFDYDGMSGVDDPIMDPTTGANVRQNVNVTAPSLLADDDNVVTANREVTVRSVNTGATGGYIGLYGQNPDGTINEDVMIGSSQYIAPGANQDVLVRFNDDYDYQAGETVYPRLFTDDPADQTFSYTTSGGTEDLPETYGYDPNTGQARYIWNTSDTGGFTVGNTTAGDEMDD